MCDVGMVLSAAATVCVSVTGAGWVTNFCVITGNSFLDGVCGMNLMFVDMSNIRYITFRIGHVLLVKTTSRFEQKPKTSPRPQFLPPQLWWQQISSSFSSSAVRSQTCVLTLFVPPVVVSLFTLFFALLFWRLS